MRGIAWKAILSEAVVTGGEALGNTKDYNCLEDSTLPYNNDEYSTVFQAVTLYNVFLRQHRQQWQREERAQRFMSQSDIQLGQQDYYCQLVVLVNSCNREE